jgi:hypothetical protein
MASIYGAAQIVLIAAEAHDPTFALPISSRSTEWQSRQASVGNIELFSYRVPNKEFCLPLETKAYTWASRAWTFQECYFARRRLFLTHTSAIYRCNNSFNLQNHHEWFPISHQRGHIAAKQVLSAYSGRQLTQQADALRAVIGALNICGSRYNFHLWGVPFRKPRNQRYPGSLALFWRHIRYTERRPGFPTWSPLSIMGGISWIYGVDASINDMELIDAHFSPPKALSAIHSGSLRLQKSPRRYYGLRPELQI